jgi:DNA polymerase-3 subunit epsilon
MSSWWVGIRRGSISPSTLGARQEAVRARPRPLEPRLTAAEIEAHRAFVATLGADALWLRYA